MNEAFGPQPRYGESAERHDSPEILRLVSNNIDALEDHSRKPIENDHRIAAYRRAVIDLLKNGDPTVIENINTINNVTKQHPSRSDMPMIYTTNLYLRALQYRMINTSEAELGAKYPEDFTDEAVWKPAIQYVGRSEGFLTELMIFSGLGIQSNVPDRYKSLKIAINSLSGRFKGQPKVLDVGCSLNIGLKAVAGNFDFFSPTVVMDKAGHVLPSVEKRADFIDESISADSSFIQGYGVDVFSPDDEMIKNWIKNSLYPSELLDRALVEYYDRLMEYASDNINFIFNDFVHPWEEGTSRYKSQLPGSGSVDIVVMSMVLYQLDDAARTIAIERAMDILAEDGLLMVQDFVVVDDGKPGELDFSPWHKRTNHAAESDRFPYKSYVLDKTEMEAGYQGFLQWDSGRCREVKLGPYALKFID